MSLVIKTHHVDHCERDVAHVPASSFSELNDYDWQQAFLPAVGLGLDVDDVIEILVMEDGEKDERDWIGLFKLKDGGVLFIESGCDYTGWDCQSSGVASLYASRTEAIKDLTDQQRERLGLAKEYLELMDGVLKRAVKK